MGHKSQREHVVGPSNGSQGQSLSPTLAQTGLGSNQSNEVCFSGPSIHEMGESFSKDDNFCPTRGYPARPDPNGPDFTRSNKE